VTQERTLLGERTVVFRSAKDAVKFYDPENLRPEKIALTNGLLSAVRSANIHHRQRLDEEEAKQKKKEVEEKFKAEEKERRKRDMEELIKETRSLRNKGERLDR